MAGLTIGLAADLDPARAVRQAISNSAKRGRIFVVSCAPLRLRAPRSERSVRSLLDHAAYYLPAERVSAFDNLRNGHETVSLSALSSWNEERSLEACAFRLRAAQVRVGIVDVTSPDAATGPLRVVHAVSPDLQQSHTGTASIVFRSAGSVHKRSASFRFTRSGSSARGWSWRRLMLQLLDRAHGREAKRLPYSCATLRDRHRAGKRRIGHRRANHHRDDGDSRQSHTDAAPKRTFRRLRYILGNRGRSEVPERLSWVRKWRDSMKLADFERRGDEGHPRFVTQLRDVSGDETFELTIAGIEALVRETLDEATIELTIDSAQSEDDVEATDSTSLESSTESSCGRSPDSRNLTSCSSRNRRGRSAIPASSRPSGPCAAKAHRSR